MWRNVSMTNSYFAQFPIIDYNNRRTRNITLSTKISEVIAGANFLYYTIRDGERPDTVAHDYYGDSNLVWLILLSNGIIDPYHEWPLAERDFVRFIVDKFGSIETAISTIKHYRKIDEVLYFQTSDPSIIIDATEFAATVDPSAWTLLEFDEEIIISVESFDVRSDKVDFESVTSYDFEFTKNEQKRTIRILERDHVNEVVAKLKELLNE